MSQKYLEELKKMAERVLEWLSSSLPKFDHQMDKRLRTMGVARYARLCFTFTMFLICIALPLWNALSLTTRVFKITHYFKHHLFKSQSWIHRSRFYHNQSFHQCLFWSIIVAIATFHGVDHDLIQVTKRMGRIPVALMPPLLFLTLRPSPLPETLYLALIPMHKWISRVVVMESLLHTIFYLWLMARNGALNKVKKLANIYGIIAMGLFILIGITSLKSIRRRNFRLFYYVHYISTWLTVILLHFHARPGVPYYTGMNCTILIVQILYRVYHTNITTITAVKISNSLTLVEFPLKDLPIHPLLPSGHVRMSIYHNNWLKRLFHFLVPLQHPYTVASLPTDRTIQLVVRNGNFPLISNQKYYVTGIFEPRLTFMSKPKSPALISDSTPSSNNPFHVSSGPLLLSRLTYKIAARRVLMCVGGSAVSFALPLLRILNFNGVNVRLIWVARNFRDLKVLNHFKNNFNGMQIYISGSTGSEQDIQIDYVDNDCGLDLFSNVPTSQPVQKSLSLPTTPLTEEATALTGTASDRGGPSKAKSYDSMLNSGLTKDMDYFGAIDPNDEVDFTQKFSARNVRSRSQDNPKNSFIKTGMLANSDVFRKPSIIEAPLTDHSGSATANDSHDEDNLPSEDSDMKLKIPSGVKVFFGRPTLGEADYAWCLQRECDSEFATDSCRLNNAYNTHVDDLSEVIVVAAGPPTLVESTRRFATDGGLHFHAESFAV